MKILSDIIATLLKCPDQKESFVICFAYFFRNKSIIS